MVKLRPIGVVNPGFNYHFCFLYTHANPKFCTEMSDTPLQNPRGGGGGGGYASVHSASPCSRSR